MLTISIKPPQNSLYGLYALNDLRYEYNVNPSFFDLKTVRFSNSTAGDSVFFTFSCLGEEIVDRRIKITVSAYGHNKQIVMEEEFFFDDPRGAATKTQLDIISMRRKRSDSSTFVVRLPSGVRIDKIEQLNVRVEDVRTGG